MNYERKQARNKFVSLFEDVLHYYKGIIITLALGAGLGFCLYAYNAYKHSQNQRAHKTLMECMKYFEAPITTSEKNEELDIDTITFASKEEKWNKVASMFHNAYLENASSGIAPFFLIFESEAALNQNKQDQAIELLSKAVNGIKDTVLKENYSLKLALMKLDNQSEMNRQNGLDLLKSLAENMNSPVHDAALFYLGDHFWNEHSFELAKNYWNQLLLSYGPDSKNPSSWSQKAKEKLKLISAK